MADKEKKLDLDELQYRNFIKYKLDEYLKDKGSRYRRLAEEMIASYKKIVGHELATKSLRVALVGMMLSDGDLIGHLEARAFDVLNPQKVDEKLDSFAKVILDEILSEREEEEDDVQDTT
mgnify:CR=1 FL=1